MALNSVCWCAGDQGHVVAHRDYRSHLGPRASAFAMVSGDGFLVGRPEEARPRLRPAVRPNARESRRAARAAPYPAPGLKRDLLRSVLQQRLVALGTVVAARIAA
ncbi:uncharacterized protein C11orf71 homolog [Ochotona curzoniae]|uniref:uncharacterized protein C11orf71 homolog n=1 Tax=Ochotona curzoniae TaxID=130825 RepID=UPI001B3458AA|nr:uncharacterized protein C11orf71 homolog [Ochotona curzoniae]